MRYNGWTLFSLALVLLGVVFWAYMATLGSATDVGVYAVGITLIAFGAIGAGVSLMSPRPQ